MASPGGRPCRGTARTASNSRPTSRVELEARARTYTLPYRDVMRAKIVVYAAQGLRNDEIAPGWTSDARWCPSWRKRFFERRLLAWRNAPAPAGRRSFPPEVAVAVKALACELPATLGVPLSRLHVPDLLLNRISAHRPLPAAA